MALSLCAACTGETNTINNPAPAAAANVVQSGTLTFENCLSNGSCAFHGTIVNAGPDCAADVRGVTHLLGAGGVDLEGQSWKVSITMRAGEQAVYHGSFFTGPHIAAAKSYRSDVSFTATKC